MKKTVISGAQPTGTFHLGNYLGAISKWVSMQDDYECLYFLVDLHAITVDRPPEELRSSIIKTAAGYLASGLDPKRASIFAQSAVKEHAELAWILNCVTPIGWLKRMTQFKDKAGKDQDNASTGLFTYPTLMAADILIYKADMVPVGDDQKQHLELTRDIAGAINRKFGKEVFKLPEPIIEGIVTRVMSLRDGNKKMSKSDLSDFSRINLNDDPELIREKFKKAKTDAIQGISYSKEARPEISNLLEIYSALAGQSIEELVNFYEGQGFAKFKADLAEVTIAYLSPIRQKYNELIKDETYLIDVLARGAEVARKKAGNTLAEIKELFGFLPEK